MVRTCLENSLKKRHVLENPLKIERLVDILQKSWNFLQKSLNISEGSLNKNTVTFVERKIAQRGD